MSWFEKKKPLPTPQGMEHKAPVHQAVSTKSSYQTTLRTAILSKEEQDFIFNPTKYINEFSPLYNKALQSSTKDKWLSRTDYIKLLIKKSLEKTIKTKEAQHFIGYLHEIKEDLKTQVPEKKQDDSTYNNLIKDIDKANTMKEVGDVNQAATLAHISNKITTDQIQKIYSLIHEKDTYIERSNNKLVDTFKSRLDQAKDTKEVGEIIREINNSTLSTSYKTQFETLAKRKMTEFLHAAQKEETDSTIMDSFKSRIDKSNNIDILNQIGIDIVDAVADGKFAKAKVIPSDINKLHELVDDKISRLYKKKIGTTEEFIEKYRSYRSDTDPKTMSITVISNEVAQLKELRKEILKTSLSQNKKDTLETIINSKINGITELKQKQEVKSLDDIDKPDFESFKKGVELVMLAVSEAKTHKEIVDLGYQIGKVSKALGSTSDPKIQELMDNLITLYNTKRRQIIDDKPKITSVSEYEISNLEYEASHVPKEMLPPQEISDVTKYIWGLPEHEAIKKYVDKELKKYQYNVDFTDKQKVDLDAIEKSKPWVLLTKAQILKEYPEKAEEYTRDLWTYKSKKSDYDKNATSAVYWRSKVEKIASGEWEKINANYLKEQWQKEVKEAISKGKPVPYDIVKMYPEFTKAQSARDRYNKGRSTSFANVSIAVDKSHQENTGIKIKRQDGKALDEKTADETIKAVSQLQSVIGDITSIMKREDLTISHTGKKHPFLSTAAGIFHGSDITISLGNHTGSHELGGHFIDETAKKRHPEKPLYDYGLVAFAKQNMNGGEQSIERALTLKKSKSEDELADARELRYMLGNYWKRVEEVWARLIEQYTAYKDKGIQGTDLLHHPYELYIKTPAYWDNVIFVSMVPKIEAELNRKIKLAGE